MAKKKKSKRTFTKLAVKWILICSMIAMFLSYILAFMGRDQIAESLSIEVVKIVVGTVLIYCLKSYFETKEEEIIKFRREKLGLNNEDNNSTM